MAIITKELERALAHRASHGLPGKATARVIAQGAGWTVSDVVCTSGPRDRSFEERHAGFSIAIVLAGTFQYRSTTGQELMTPGSLLLGNPGQCFECGHEHGWGDRCLSFYYAPDYFENLAAGAGLRSPKPDFAALRLPPSSHLSSVIAQACSGLARGHDACGHDWEALSIRLAVRTAGGLGREASTAPPSAVARITRVLRSIEHNLDTNLTLRSLAKRAGLSPYHFLRIFERLTGLTPHQYLLRSRLREAATRLVVEPSKIIDIALDCASATFLTSIAPSAGSSAPARGRIVRSGLSTNDLKGLGLPFVDPRTMEAIHLLIDSRARS